MPGELGENLLGLGVIDMHFISFGELSVAPLEHVLDYLTEAYNAALRGKAPPS